MTEQSQESIKVYELAKELGLDSFTLLDKLKAIQIEVKSHMSSLGENEVAAIRSHLQNEQKIAQPKPTKAIARKKVSTEKIEAVSASNTKKVAEAVSVTTTKKKVIKRKAGATEEKEASGSHLGVTTEKYIPEEEVVSEQPRGHKAVTAAAEMVSEVKTTRGPVVNKVSKDEALEEFSQRKLKIVKEAPPAQEQDNKNKIAPKVAPVEDEDSAARKRAPFKAGDTFADIQEQEIRKRTAAVPKKDEEIRIADFRKRELVFQPKRRKLPPGKQVRKTLITTPGVQKRKIRIEEKITVADLAHRLGEKVNDIVAKLVALGIEATAEQTIDFETAALLAEEFKYEVENVAFKEEDLLKEEELLENLKPRPPIVTVMGHVDHGKTSLLDAIRNANVASKEAGGITQHIGAYSVLSKDKPITFLDTPGHEAFAAMRARGATLTDIVVLVVAADDGVMPQTREAIQHAQAAKVPIIVAVNKIDKPGANLERIKQMLAENNVLCEEWGGEVPLVPVSALKKTGIDDLLETISLSAEMLELKANPDRRAEGVILESRLQKGRGGVVDVLVKQGTLKVGDPIMAGNCYGKVRAMMDDHGKSAKSALPGFPVEIIGFDELPGAGEVFYITKTEDDAKAIVEARKEKIRAKEAEGVAKPLTVDELFAGLPKADEKLLNIIIKTDVFGSSEAIREMINKIESQKVKVKIISCGVGVITENDVLLAKTSGARIFTFHTQIDTRARELAKREKIEIKSHDIIYELLKDIRSAMEDLLDPIRIEKHIGSAEVRQAFTVSKSGLIAGSAVAEGKIQRNAYARVFRQGKIIHEGKISSLKRFKDDVSETTSGQECGIGVQGYEDIQPGDKIEALHVELQKATLE